jgi:hypothetical protein
MGIFTNPILDLIAKQPGIRTVEIADLVDCDVDMVDKAIKAQIDAGVILVEAVHAPNGHPTSSYRHAKPVALLAPESGIDVPIDSQAMPSAELPAFLEKKEKTKTQMGIDCIVANSGRATISQLHEALGLRKEQSVTPFMNHPLAKGLVARDGRDWILGPNHPGYLKFVSSQLDELQAELQVALNGQENLVDAEEPDIEELPPEGFICALWSDGEFVMARDGKVIAKITASEYKALRRYVTSTTYAEGAPA